MRRWLILLLLVSLPAQAMSAAELYQQVNAELERAPWRARLVGEMVGPGGDLQAADMTLTAVPAAKTIRIDFVKPDALADNYVVITPEKVYNYLFLTNQVVVYPRDRARIEGLGLDLSRIGDLSQLGADDEVAWGEPETASLSGQAAWRVTGRAADPETAGFARIEVWISQKPLRPLRTVFYSSGGDSLSDLWWKSFEHLNIGKDDLLDFPPDAEWIEKK